jgi:hypothetical protein
LLDANSSKLEKESSVRTVRFFMSVTLFETSTEDDDGDDEVERDLDLSGPPHILQLAAQ